MCRFLNTRRLLRRSRKFRRAGFRRGRMPVMPRPLRLIFMEATRPEVLQADLGCAVAGMHELIHAERTASAERAARMRQRKVLAGRATATPAAQQPRVAIGERSGGAGGQGQVQQHLSLTPTSSATVAGGERRSAAFPEDLISGCRDRFSSGRIVTISACRRSMAMTTSIRVIMPRSAVTGLAEVTKAGLPWPVSRRSCRRHDPTCPCRLR